MESGNEEILYEKKNAKEEGGKKRDVPILYSGRDMESS